MKSMLVFLLIALIVIPSLAACAPSIPGQRPPPNGGQPYNGNEPDPRPQNVPDSFIGVRVYFYGHDRSDFDKVIPFKFNILAHAFNPELLGGFVEPDTGRAWSFRDPATKVDLLVEPDQKATPYGFTVWFPPEEVIDFKIAYSFAGDYGDVVGCEFQTALGTSISRTRTTAGIFNVPRDSDEQGFVQNLCIYTVNVGDLS
jgi:hypothetical protein